MFKLNGYEVNGVQYIVIEEKDNFFNRTAMELLASRKYGVGADRMLIVDDESLLTVVDETCGVQVPSADDYAVYNSFKLGSCENGVYSCEIRLTDYFLQQLVTAGAINMNLAC